MCRLDFLLDKLTDIFSYGYTLVKYLTVVFYSLIVLFIAKIIQVIMFCVLDRILNWRKTNTITLTDRCHFNQYLLHFL